MRPVRLAQSVSQIKEQAFRERLLQLIWEHPLPTHFTHRLSPCSSYDHRLPASGLACPGYRDISSTASRIEPGASPGECFPGGRGRMGRSYGSASANTSFS